MACPAQFLSLAFFDSCLPFPSFNSSIEPIGDHIKGEED